MFAWIKKFLPHQQILTHVQDRLPQTDNWAHKIHNPVKKVTILIQFMSQKYAIDTYS